MLFLKLEGTLEITYSIPLIFSDGKRKLGDVK